MSDYDAVKNPLRRSTFRQPPPPQPDMVRNVPAVPTVPQLDGFQPNANSTQAAHDALRDIYRSLCNDLSTDTFAAVLRLFPADDTAMQFRATYERLERATYTSSALAVCLFCVVQTLHQHPDATTMLLHTLFNSLQRLENQIGDLPKHTGSTEVLYNHIYGMLAYCAVNDEAITMQELQQIFQTHRPADLIYLCFNDWLRRS